MQSIQIWYVGRYGSGLQAYYFVTLPFNLKTNGAFLKSNLEHVYTFWPIIIITSYYVHPPGGWIYYFCFFRRPMSDVRCPLSDVRCPMSGVRRPMSGVTHGFRSFKGKVFELLSPNLVCRLIGSVACLGLLLAVVPLLLTE